MTYTEFSTDIKRTYKDYCRLQSNNRNLRIQISFLKNELYTLQAKREKPIVKTDIQKYINIAVECINKEIPCELWMMSAKSRKREIVIPRQIAMYLLRVESAYSLPVIGLNFGGRDHSTVIASIRTINDIIDTERVMGGKIKKIIEHYKNETTT